MTVGRIDHGPVRLRRRGRHKAPSQIEKVAQQAGKAAPAVAIAGALVAVPQASHALATSTQPVPVTAQGHSASSAHGTTSSSATHSATLDSVETRTVTVTAATSARHAATTQSTTYRVRSGDTLSKLANRFFHNNDWQYLYHENDKTISDPNLIYVGESLVIPASAPAQYSLSGYVPQHAKSTDTAESTTQSTASSTGSSSSTSTTQSTASSTTQTESLDSSQGQYSCSSLEQLWEQEGGSSSSAFMAAEIAMAESSGNPNAISPTDDYGLWQINISNGSLATLNPQENAKSAIILSDDGTNWSPWTTYTSGAYVGKC